MAEHGKQKTLARQKEKSYTGMKETYRKEIYMNIKQAKNYIKESVQLYLKKDEFGSYRIPVVRQRPIFLLGAPGVGKTAIMEQIAEELGIALVSYSMTHHTRQSALGLPFISHKEYGGKSYDISEYTMSEIIASIYETMEESGITEGILFLDEINCVSETLAPSMLQFLQYKVFGRHQVPEGWVIVTAGNPPEYNKSVREFDVVTMDRLKVLDVEAEYSIWREYAIEKGLHNVIMNFLDLKKEYFYKIESTVKGRSYVTARGWEDLSEILNLYEEEKLKVDETLVGQYLRNDRAVKEFTAYYDLYQKYKRDYQIEDILQGKVSDFALAKAERASFDERLSLLGMLMDKVLSEMMYVLEKTDYLSEMMAPLKAVRAVENLDAGRAVEILAKQAEGRQKKIESLERANALSNTEKKKNLRIIRFLTDSRKDILKGDAQTGEEIFGIIKSRFDRQVEDMKQETLRVQEHLHFLFSFVEKAFQEGNEMLVLVTELTVNKSSAGFIARFGCEDYQKHNGELMITERQNDMQEKIASLEL